MKEVKFFSKGLFETKFMSSRIKTNSMTMKEKILGFLIGPFGTAAFIAVMQSLLELFYTERFYIDEIYGKDNYLILAWVSKIAAIIFGIIFGYVVEHNVSKEGKIRPLILIGSIILSISGFFCFYIPEFGNNTLKLIWVYIFNILYHGVGLTLVMLKINLNTLCTRNQDDRNQVNLFTKISEFMLVGTGVTLVVGSILYYTMLHNTIEPKVQTFPIENWYTLVLAFGILSLVLSFVHYFYTKERITENNKKEEVNISIFNQVKYMFKSKYWVIAFIISFILTSFGNLQGANLNTNFCSVVLGATSTNNYNLIYTICSGVPLGLGLLFIYPICKKFTIRKTTIAFGLLVIVSSIVGYLFKNNFLGATISYFFFNLGTIPVVYILYSLIYAANDEVEYKYGFRVEGTMALAITTALSNLLSGVFAGVYETGLGYAGYDPDIGTLNPNSVYEWIYFVKYWLPIIVYGLLIILLFFLKIENDLPHMQEQIELRHKEEALARGEVYVSPQELAKLEAEENARISEEWRIKDLKIKCERKGLEFDTENQKYLDKKNKKK